MGKFILKRLLMMIPMLIGITLISYLIIDMSPGDPVTAFLDPIERSQMTDEEIQDRYIKLGLDQPVMVRYVKWLGEIFKGNLGYSYVTNRSIAKEIGARLGVTVGINLVALTLAMVFGILLGVLCALKQYKWQDYLISTMAFIGGSIPSFFFALLLVIVFSIKLDWFPTTGLRDIFAGKMTPFEEFLDVAHHCVLPITVYTVLNMSGRIRMQRAAFLEVKQQDYVRTAVAKGMSDRVVNLRHILKNASLPTVTSLANLLPAMISGSFMIESIFGLPGLGNFGTTAVLNRDYPVVMATLLISSILVMLGMLLSDILYALLDPQIRY